MDILVTGGCGYIGSHTVYRLSTAGHQVTVFDNLSSGRREAVLPADLCLGDLRDEQALEDVFAQHHFSAVIHFAASISSPESVEKPADYYDNNLVSTLNLLRCCQRHKIKYFLYSSSAAVYGMVTEQADAISEDTAINPISPYGWSKWMGERMLIDVAQACGMHYGILRYYNVAGADRQARFGQSPSASHLIRVAVRAACQGHPADLTIFGDDYDTKDGTCVRDYIHVADLADVHVQIINYLNDKQTSVLINCGYGQGYSVKEVVDVVRKVTAYALPIRIGERRAGDPPILVADPAKLKHLLNWQPQYNDIETIVYSAWQWEKKLQAGIWGKP